MRGRQSPIRDAGNDSILDQPGPITDELSCQKIINLWSGVHVGAATDFGSVIRSTVYEVQQARGCGGWRGWWTLLRIRRTRDPDEEMISRADLYEYDEVRRRWRIEGVYVSECLFDSAVCF